MHPCEPEPVNQSRKNRRSAFAYHGRAFRIIQTARGRNVFLALVFVCASILGQPSISEALMAGQGLMWSVLPDEPVKLSVCWLNPADANPLPGETATASGEDRREWVRLALKSSWERYGRILFTGWGTCQDEAQALPPPNTLGPRRPGTGDENIKIQITSDGGGMNPGHGSPGDFASPGVLLNLHPNKPNNLSLWLEMQYLAIHEFGHVLGYYHDEERQDWPSTPACPEQWSNLSGLTLWPWWPIPTEIRYGAPDTGSIMAYCAGRPIALTPRDIAGVQRGYGRHLPGTLLSAPGSQCLASHASAPDGEGAFGWECDEAFDDQEWMYDRRRGALYIRRAYAGDNTPRCLDVNTNNLTDLQIWTCHYGANQQWQFRRIYIRGYGGLCLTRPASGAGSVTMETCSGDSTKLWLLEPGHVPDSFRIRGESSLYCLAARGASGSAIVAEPCDSLNRVFLPLVLRVGLSSSEEPAGAWGGVGAPVATAQDFYLISGGELRPSAMTGKCLDVRDVWNSDYLSGQGGPAVGQSVQVFDCVPSQLNQKWNFSGNLMSVGKCLTLGGNYLANGAPATVGPCSGLAAQVWDYYW